MFNTAENLEDLNMVDEILSYETVIGIEEQYQICDDDYKDADFYITLRDDSELQEIKDMLNNSGGWSAYIEIDDTVIRHN